MRLQRGQVGIETMAIVGFMLLMMLPLIYLLLARGGMFNEQTAVAKADETAASLTAMADQVGKMGPGSKVVVQLEVPGGIMRSYAVDKEFGFSLQTSAGRTDVVHMSRFILSMDANTANGLTTPGTHYVLVESMGTLPEETVSISSTLS
ncbi:Uncharacterised protein [Candidatus Burarchaeum australiense]|nr:Uncharacterised protein [Candidatus Burarchaeum australiense]